MINVKKPEIIKKTIVIDDDYARKNRRSDGKIKLLLGGATLDNKIIIYKYVIDRNANLTNDEIADMKQRLRDVTEQDIIAHESQHIHNRSGGYNYLAYADNIYECMMLALADEVSAQMAGYLHKHQDIDSAVAATIKNMNKDVRMHYIQVQFKNHFTLLQKTWGEYKNLFEYKYDSKKILGVIDWYFTINGNKVMNQMSKKSQIEFNNFITEIKTEIKDFIQTHIATHRSYSQVNTMVRK